MANDSFARGFAATFGKGVDVGAKGAQTAIAEKIKKQQEKTAKEIEKTKAQTTFEAIRQQLPEKIKAEMGDIDVTDIGTDALKSINTALGKQLVPKQKSDLEKKIETFDALKKSKDAGPAGRQFFEQLTKQELGQQNGGIGQQITAQTKAQPKVSSTPTPQQIKVQEIPGDKFSTMVAPEVDPFTGKPTQRGLQQKARNDVLLDGLKVGERKIVEANIKKKDLAQELENFFLVDDQIARGTGFVDRIQKGLSTVGASLDQSTVEGFAAATHEGAVKRLRVKLVRAAGDVGNLNIVEQEAAEKIVPSKFDSAGTAELKRAFLREAAKAIKSIDDVTERESEIKKVLNKFAKSEAFKGPKGKEADKLTGKSDAQTELDEINKKLEALGG